MDRKLALHKRGNEGATNSSMHAKPKPECALPLALKCKF